MRTLSTDINNDIFMKDGRLKVVGDLECIMKNCEYAAKSQLGEMLFAIDRGVPNLQTVWVRSTNVAQFEVYLREILLSVTGVTGISALDVKVADNTLLYSVTIQTDFGEAVVTNGL